MRLSGKFNAEEAEIIERIMKKYNLNDNQLVRKSVMFAVENAEYENLILRDPKFMKMMKLIGDETKKIMSKKRFYKKLFKTIFSRIQEFISHLIYNH